MSSRQTRYNISHVFAHHSTGFIHDPTFPHTSLVSSLGAVQQDGYILVVNKHSHPDSKHDYTDIYTCQASRQRLWAWRLLVVMTVEFTHAITCLVSHTRSAKTDWNSLDKCLWLSLLFIVF